MFTGGELGCQFRLARYRAIYIMDFCFLFYLPAYLHIYSMSLYITISTAMEFDVPGYLMNQVTHRPSLVSMPDCWFPT